MARNSITQALILSTTPSGENNRSVCYFSPDSGISYAILYGGPKSKMKGLVLPFNRGNLYIYTDEVRKSTKITDFDVQNFHPTFRESLFKSWAASLAAEIIIKTRAAGSPSDCWILINGFLDGLELTDEKNGRLGMIRFLWRYLDLLGILPDTENCCSCGSSFFAGNFEENEVSSLNKYNPSENGFYCKNCASENGFDISFQALHYLNATTKKTPKEVRAIQIDANSVNQMKQLVFYLIEVAVGQKLKSIESGLGIL